jgi:protein SCO1/2
MGKRLLLLSFIIAPFFFDSHQDSKAQRIKNSLNLIRGFVSWGLCGMFLFFPSDSLAFGQYHDQMKQMKALLASKQTIGRKIGDYSLTDQDGNRFNLKDYRGKAYIINFIYTSCPHTCGVSTSIISEAVKRFKKDSGKDVDVITIGFDIERDTPNKMREYGEAFVKDFKYWKFASGDKNAINEITNKLGFYYKKRDDSFDHLNMISVIDLNGEVYNNIVYGEDESEDKVQGKLIGSLERLLLNNDKVAAKSLGLLEKIKLMCSEYDPSSQAYKFSYYYFLTKFILGNILFFIAPLILLWRREILSFFKGCKGLITRIFKAT